MSVGALAGKRVVLTAAGSISRTLAEAMLAEGAIVTLAHASREQADAVATSIGSGPRGRVLDMSSAGSLAAFVDQAARDGGIDVLVNHQSLLDVGPFVETTRSDYDRLFDANVKDVFFTLQQVARLMIAQGRGGSIVNRLGQLGSTTRDRPGAVTAVFNATQAALVSLTRSAALALASHGIRVNAVAPGPLALPMWDDLGASLDRASGRSPGQTRSSLAGAVPLGRRFGTAADLVGATVFLASDASAFVTGQVVDVDGGLGLTS